MNLSVNILDITFKITPLSWYDGGFTLLSTEIIQYLRDRGEVRGITLIDVGSETFRLLQAWGTWRKHE